MDSQEKTAQLRHVWKTAEVKKEDTVTKENVFAKTGTQDLLAILKPVLILVPITGSVSKENVNAS